MASAEIHGNGVTTDAAALRAYLGSRVKGQDHILDDVSEFLVQRLAQPRGGRPLASLCFIGGNADGKTTLASAIAQLLYGEKGAVRFDGSSFQEADARSTLVGAPVGYIGVGRGGLLTGLAIENPRRLILFEHFERVHESAWPVLFEMLTEGKLVEAGTGRIADFSQAIVVLMSKANRTGFYETFGEIPDPAEAAQEVIARWSRNPENPEEPFRPGILSRVEKTYVFRPLSGPAQIEIMCIKAAEIVKDYGLELAGIDSRVVLDIVTRRPCGLREFERAFDEEIGDGLIAAKEAGWRRVRIDFTGGKAVVSRDE